MTTIPLEPTSSSVMPSENSFKQHIALVRAALKTFNTICQLDAPGPVKTAFDELVNVTADLNKFVPFFVSHSLFQELPPLVHAALEDFLTTRPSFDKPLNFSKIAGLNARAQDSVHISARRGKYLLSFESLFSLTIVYSCYQCC